MGKIFLFSIRRMIRQRCAVWFFLMIGMTLLSFCISVILGFVSRSYFNETQFGANASLAVWYGENGSNKEAAREVGKMVAEAAKQKGIEVVVFDRGGYLYHGRVAELAEGAREGGLKF